MVETLEVIKAGADSIKTTTTGRVSALVIRELQSLKSSSKGTAAERPQLQKSLDGASSTSSATTTDHQGPEDSRKTKDCKNNYGVPILSAKCLALDGTPAREKPKRRGPNIMEVVDTRNPDRAGPAQ